jgi:arabinogalactan oligomer/maltooligosaccharide transport system permease protein
MKLILVLGMFPGFLTLIVVYQVLKLMNLQASLFGLILCYTGGAGMNYYVLKGFFDTISKSVDEAAMIDGCNKWQIFTKITMPLSKPIIVYTILTSFMGPWGEYVTSSYIMGTNRNSYTLAVGLYKMTDATLYLQKYWLQFCSGSVLIAIPIAILFMCLQKYYVSGITGGAVKG